VSIKRLSVVRSLPNGMNILSIDVEEIFHAEYARHLRGKDVTYRTPISIPLILEFLEDYDVKATFFIVGELAEKFPEVLKMIIDSGHEVAFHGWSHVPLRELNQEAFRREVVRFKELVPDCIGFRAPSFSLNNNTRWALKVLKEQGFRYDSSIFPTWTPLYGVYGAPQKPYMPSIDDVAREGNPNYGLIEFPLPVYNFLGLRLPIAGGFWLRILNLSFIKNGIRKLNREGTPAIVYVHSWELDTETPKLRLSPWRSFVTYHNINKTRGALGDLLVNFDFISFAEYIRAIRFIQR